MKKLFTILTLALAMALAGCGERVTVLGNQIAVVADGDGLQRDDDGKLIILSNTNKRLEHCGSADTSCEKLYLVDKESIPDQFIMKDRYFPKDKETGSYTVNVVFDINPLAYEKLFAGNIPMVRVNDEGSVHVYKVPVRVVYERFAEKQMLAAIDYIHTQHSITDLLSDSDNVTKLFKKELSKHFGKESIFIPRFVGVEDVKPSENILSALTRESRIRIAEENDKADHERQMKRLKLKELALMEEARIRGRYLSKMKPYGYTADHEVYERVIETLVYPDESRDSDQDVNLSLGVPMMGNMTPASK